MRGGKIVAVEFLFEWASLLAHVDRAADGDHARHFVHRPNDLDRHRIPGSGSDCRNIVRAVKHLQVGREQSVVARSRSEPERLEHPQPLFGYRP